MAGLGDLVLTCTGEWRLGDIVSSTTMIAEGVETTAAAVNLSRRFHTDMPITQQMGRLLKNEVTPREAMRSLMERTLTDE